MNNKKLESLQAYNMFDPKEETIYCSQCKTKLDPFYFSQGEICPRCEDYNYDAKIENKGKTND